MTTHEVTMVRIYMREAEHLLGKVIHFLHDEAKVRGIEGFAQDGALRTASLLDLSLDLPLIVEFYDDSDKAEGIIATLINEMHLQHIISFPAKAYSRNA